MSKNELSRKGMRIGREMLRIKDKSSREKKLLKKKSAIENGHCHCKTRMLEVFRVI